MKVLFAAVNTIESDGQNYFSNTIPVMCKRYQVLGDDITVICHKKKVKKPKSFKIESNSIKIITIEKTNTLKKIIFGTSNVEPIFEKEMKKADLLIAHLPSKAGYKAIKYAKLFNKPYVTVLCGCPWDALWNYDWRGKILAPRSFLRLRKTQKNAPYSIYVTKFFLQKRYPTKGKWINCSNVEMKTGLPGVLEQRLTNIAQRRTEGRILRIGTAAAIDVPYKGQEFVIRALAKLKERGVHMEYYMIGNGNKERLQAIVDNLGINDRVFFLGGVPHDKVADFYDDMDIYVQPSKQEGLPRSLIEAKSRGCLCLGSITAGIPELLEPKYLFSKGNVKQIVEVLENIKPEDFVIQAKKNFETAKDYDCDVLNERRNKFLLEFKEKSFPTE